MNSKARLPVVAMLGALLLHASGAYAREDVVELPQAPGDQPAPAPAVQPIPPEPDAPPMLVPGSGPALYPIATTPASPVPALSLNQPTMIHERRDGLIIAGGVTFIAAYLVQLVLAFGVTLSGIDGAPPGNYGVAGLLTLIPIIGPWVGPSSVGEPLGTKWVLGWGAIEAGAVAMMIAGSIGHDVPEKPEGPKVSLAPLVTPEGNGLSLRLRW